MAPDFTQEYGAACGDVFVVVVPPSSEPTEVRVTLCRLGWRRRLAFAFDKAGAFAMPQRLREAIENRAA